MIINPKPGNHPDPGDMSGTFEDGGGQAEDTAATQHHLDEEEEAARLGDFA
jgi:hypothetical protein